MEQFNSQRKKKDPQWLTEQTKQGHRKSSFWGGDIQQWEHARQSVVKWRKWTEVQNDWTWTTVVLSTKISACRPPLRCFPEAPCIRWGILLGDISLLRTPAASQYTITSRSGNTHPLCESSIDTRTKSHYQALKAWQSSSGCMAEFILCSASSPGFHRYWHQRHVESTVFGSPQASCSLEVSMALCQFWAAIFSRHN